MRSIVIFLSVLAILASAGSKNLGAQDIERYVLPDFDKTRRERLSVLRKERFITPGDFVVEQVAVGVVHPEALL